MEQMPVMNRVRPTTATRARRVARQAAKVVEAETRKLEVQALRRSAKAASKVSKKLQAAAKRV
jgi:hypothetical protein